MIVRHIPMKSVLQSSFSGLVKYITSEQGKQERLGEVTISNCQSTQINWATYEVAATQAQNQRAKGDKTYHLLISFAPGENPTAFMLKDIEQRVCAAIGFSAHQRISAIHYDTDNLHIHIAINKIHPISFTLHEPFRAYKTLGDIAVKLEKEHGLQQTNHYPKKVGSENRADDMEHHSGIQSLLNWIKKECGTQLINAKSWPDFHAILNENGLRANLRGNGLVIQNKEGITVKASSVQRSLSKQRLEQRLGSFLSNKTSLLTVETTSSVERYYEPKPLNNKLNTVELYSSYQTERADFKTLMKAELKKARDKRDKLIAQTLNSGKLKRSSIKLVDGDRLSKKILYSLTSKHLKSEIDHIKQAYQKEHHKITEKYQCRIWADWLKQKATDGNTDALLALRAREKSQDRYGNALAGKGSNTKQPIKGTVFDSITKEGTIIYRVGRCAIHDKGTSLKISKNSNYGELAVALEMAQIRFGSIIKVEGTEHFKEQILLTAASLKLPIKFDDRALENRRIQLINDLITKEQSNEHRRQSTIGGGTDRGSNETSQRTKYIHFRSGRAINDGRDRVIGKPNVGSIGRQPPPQSKNHLRTMSQLGVVQFSERSEMLLPSHVLSDLEHQGTQSTHSLRRDVSGARINPIEWGAADRYITEREDKRQMIKDILPHRRYNKITDNGTAKFAGIRHINNEFLALLQKNEEILVLPIKDTIVHELKKLSIGARLKLSTHGISLTTSRKR